MVLGVIGIYGDPLKAIHRDGFQRETRNPCMAQVWPKSGPELALTWPMDGNSFSNLGGATALRQGILWPDF